jgi:transcriptional regulator with XRE-family HTH domain
MTADEGVPHATRAPAPEGGFGEVLRRLRAARGASQAAVAARAGMDRSYVNRLEAGERGAPHESAVEALARALDLSGAEADHLLAAAGLLPRALRALGAADPTLVLLAQRLTDSGLSAAARAALRATVEAVARHWADPPAVPAGEPPPTGPAPPAAQAPATAAPERSIEGESRVQ